METKIIDNKGTGTVILNNGAGKGSGTVIINNAPAGGAGKSTASGSGTSVLPVVKEKTSDSNFTRFSGQPLVGPQAKGIEILGYTITDVMESTSSEADLFYAEKNGERFVLKYYRGSHKPKSEVVKVIKNLKNPHIIKLYEYGFYNGRFFEIYEYAKAGKITSQFPLKEEQVFEICKDIVNAFKEFHDAGIIHRDIKPENFFLRSEEPLDVVIGDFGIASIMEDGEELHKTQTKSHTVGYAPIEIITADYMGLPLGFDYYSLGITLWEFATGRKPFVYEDTGLPRPASYIMTDTCEGLIADDLLSREPILSPRLQKLIRGLLVVDYKKRWGYSEVTRFINGEDVEVARNEVKKIKFPILGKIYDDKEKLVNDLWNKRKEVSFSDFNLVCEIFEKNYGHIPKFKEGIPAIKDEITDRYDLEIPLLKLIYLIDDGRSFPIGEGYSITTKADILELLETAPEMLVNALKEQKSLNFILISLILGEEIKEIKKMIAKETEWNKKYYNMSDYLFNLKLVSKTRILLKGKTIEPFMMGKYKPVLSEISDLNGLNEELKEVILEDVRENNYEGDIIPWIELKTGHRIEDFAAQAREEDWDAFYNALCQEEEKK